MGLPFSMFGDDKMKQLVEGSWTRARPCLFTEPILAPSGTGAFHRALLCDWPLSVIVLLPHGFEQVTRDPCMR